MMTKQHIVWNENKTEGFITTDEQLAYEVRKGADSNLYDRDGHFHPVAKAFCDEWGHENCTTQVIELE